MTADFASESRLRRLVAWTRDRDGDWCLLCQERRDGENELQRTMRAHAGHRR